MEKVRFFLLIISILGLFSGCATNPVTGEREITLISEKQELQLGKSKYQPLRQVQGGDYVLEPELTRYVQNVGNKLVRVSDRKLPYEFKIVNDSTPNAWALPGGKIAINRGLLVEMDSEAELAAVLAHEIVHAAARHSANAMERSILLQGAVIAAGIALDDNEYRNTAMLGAGIGANLVNLKYGRDAEREADHYGMKYMIDAGYDPNAAVQLQKTLLSLSKNKNPSWLAGLLASHPPSQERVDNNLRDIKKYKVNAGYIGRDTYRRKTDRIRKNAKAYEYHDEAKKALSKKQPDKALSLINKAIRIEPKEALFHGLKGEIRKFQKKDSKALTNFNRAITLNPDYYRFHLLRGLVKKNQGNLTASRADILKSNQLLATAESHYSLAEIENSLNNPQAAIKHLRLAAQSSSSIGKQAKISLARMELEQKPSKYISASLLLTKDGYLQVAVRNKSPVRVSGVKVAIGRAFGNSLTEQANVVLRQALKPGQKRIIKTGIGPINVKQARNLAAVVTRAKIAN